MIRIAIIAFGYVCAILLAIFLFSNTAEWLVETIGWGYAWLVIAAATMAGLVGLAIASDRRKG